MMIKLNNWSTCFNNDPYTPPECSTLRVQGNVRGHPRFEDGSHITSSHIVAVKGRMVTTASGSVYRLGKIDPKFRQWLREQGRAYDQHNPIRVLA